MALLQSVRNRLSTIGIVFYQKSPLNVSNLFTLAMLCFGSFFNCAHLLYEAKTFKEFADSVCASSAMIVASISFGIFIWKTRPIYDCLNNVEKSVTKREYIRQNALLCYSQLIFL